eukprot:ANDGO_07902.mRNA.1 Transmembrane protein 258 homolog
MTRYVYPTADRPLTSPLPSEMYPLLTFLLFGGGLVFAVFLFLYIMTVPKRSRDVYRELTFAIVSAIQLGFGTLFLLLWCGLYV